MQPGHITDIFPTLMEVAGVKYPEKSASGEATIPLEGQSLLPIWEGQSRQKPFEKGWEHEGNRAYRQGEWKLVSTNADKKWELYDLRKDPVEVNDLSAKNPAKLAEMKRLYQHWAAQVGAEDRAAVQNARKNK